MAVDYFLKLEGISGESSDTVHAGEIDVLGWDFGLDTPHNMKEGRTSDAQMRELVLTLPSSVATPRLLGACFNNQSFKKVVLTCRKAGTKPQEYMTITLDRATIAGYELSGSGSGTGERLTFTYGALTLAYKPQRPDGSLGSPVAINVVVSRARRSE